MAEANPQVPQYQNPDLIDPSILDEMQVPTDPVPEDHIEKFDYRKHSLPDAIRGGRITIPSGPTDELRSPARFRENTDGIIPETKKGITKTQKIIGAAAGAAVLSGGIFLSLFKGAESGTQKAIENMNGGNVGNSAPALPGQEGVSGDHGIDYSKVDAQSLTVDQFYDDTVYPQEYRVKWANEIIKERGQKAHDELSSILVAHGHPALKPLVAPDINNTGSEIMVQHDVVNYLASTDPDKTEGAKLLAASVDSETAADAKETVNGEPMVAFHTVPQNSATGTYMESPVFSYAIAGNYQPNGIPSKVIVYTNGITSKSSESIEQFIGGSWVTHDVMGPDDPGLVRNPQQVADK